MNNLIILFSLVCVTVHLSCEKEEGCLDTDADNYNSNAEIDDKSCTFSGKTVLWFDEATSDSLQNAGVTILTFYIDDEIEGGNDVADFQTFVPECTDDVSFTHKKSFGTAKTGLVSYRVNNQYGEDLWTGTIELEANSCKSVELNF